MGVAQENRNRKRIIESGRAVTDKQREIEAATMIRGQRPPAIAPKPPASRRVVKAWMRRNAEEYEDFTKLAEAANIEFELPGDGLDDETHWVWDEAINAIGFEN